MIREYLGELLRTHPIKLALGTASICAVVGYLVFGRRKRWVKVGKVGKLYIFPLKSGAVTESPKLYFQSMGPRYKKAVCREIFSFMFPRLGPLIDRGFAVVNAGTHTIRDTHCFPRLCVVQLQIQSGQVCLTSPDNKSPLLFSLPSDFQSEPESRFVSTSVIGSACSSVWDCGEEAASWISWTLTNKESGLRLVYHYSQVSMRTHSPQVSILREMR